MWKMLKFRMSETCTRPHFANHTQSSLMKSRTPMKLKKKSASKDVNESKKSEGNIILKLSRIHKKRSGIIKRSRSMQMMITILKQQRDRATIFLPGTELTETAYQLDNSLASFQSDLIKDVSHDLKKCAGSPVKLATLYDQPIKVISKFVKRAENSHASQDEMNCTGRDNSENIPVSNTDHAIVDVALQLHSSDEEKPADSHCKVEILHRRTESEKKLNNFPNEDYSEIETHLQDENAVSNRKRMRKTWRSRKAGTRNEHVDVDRACPTDLQNYKSTKHIANSQDNSANNKLVVNTNAIIRKRDTLQKNLASNQRVWRPPGISKTRTTESTTSLQPISQKSHLAEKSTASSKHKYSTKHIEAFNNESTSTSVLANQSKMLMKENRDPRTMKIRKHLTAEGKRQQRLQSGGTLPKRRRSRTKIDAQVLDRNDANPTVSKSKSRHCQTRPIMPKESADSSNVGQHRANSALIYEKGSKTLEVIYTLKKIIDNVTEDDEENVVNDNFDREKNDSEIQTLNRDLSSQNNKLHIFTKNINLDKAARSSRRSIDTQTELDLPSYKKINAEKNQDFKILTRTVATQTSPSCNRNVIKIGCNTFNAVYNDAEITCDLIDFTNSEIEADPVTIEDKSTLSVPIHTESSSVKCIKINVESEDTNGNRELSLNRCKETLNTKMSLKLENYDSVEIPAKTTTDAAAEIEKITQEKACQISVKLSTNSDDKINTDIDKQGSTKCSNNHDANNISINNLLSARVRPSIDYDACSSEEIVENNVRYEDMVSSELKLEDIPSGVIKTFELAAERARNLHEAIIIYRETLMSRESEKRNEVEDYETSEFRDDQHCLGTYVPFISRINENKIKSECEAIYRFANNDENFDGFSTCSSRGSSADRICQFERFPRSSEDNYVEIDREEENAILSENERAIASERSDLKDVKSFMQLVHHTQEEYALELLQSERKESDASFETEGAINKNLALPAAIKKTCFISRENLFPLIYCVICTVVFWFLQFSFRCDSTK